MACHDTLFKLAHELEKEATSTKNFSRRFVLEGLAARVWKAHEEHLAETKAYQEHLRTILKR